MQEKRKIVGTFVPLSSLYGFHQSPQDFGTFASGMPFLTWLHDTKQNAWQVLPLHETHLEGNSTQKHVPSPYKGYGVGLDSAYLPSSRSQSARAPVPRMSPPLGQGGRGQQKTSVKLK